ncbi:MAG: hypothetical protein ABIO37_16240, partial [Caulobacteraceae bacterium]
MIRRISPQRYVALLIGLGVAGSLAYSTSFAMKFAGVLVGFGVGLAVYQPPEPDPAKWPYQYRFTPQIQRMNAAIVV